MSEIVEVVSAIIVRDGRLLLTQRLASKDFPLTWESPGGKVDGAESHHVAIARELREEIGIEVTAIAENPSWSGKFDNAVTRPDRASIHLAFYRVLAFAGEPRPLEGQGIGWFTPAEVPFLKLAPGNEAAREVLTIAINRARNEVAGKDGA